MLRVPVCAGTDRARELRVRTIARGDSRPREVQERDPQVAVAQATEYLRRAALYIACFGDFGGHTYF